MIHAFTLENFGPIQKLEAQNLGSMNVILAENNKGKTFILKALYSVIKSHEQVNRGKNNRSIHEELRDKLYWTFQTEKIGDLVNTSNKNNKLAININLNNQVIEASFSSQVEKMISIHKNELVKREVNSVFLPTKEVFFIFKVIQNSAYNKLFGFDATYVDLVRALDGSFNEVTDLVTTLGSQLQHLEGILNSLPKDKNLEARKQELYQRQQVLNSLRQTLQAKSKEKNTTSNKMNDDNQKIYHEILLQIEKFFDGSVQFNEEKQEWIYKKNNHGFSMNATAEGVKKIAVLENLLRNRFLKSGSIIFIDEPEVNLHPKAINQFLDILYLLSKAGMQIFMTSHSYFVIKKLHLLAKQNNESIPVLMAKSENWVQEDLVNGMPENEIINESIRLFEEELGL